MVVFILLLILACLLFGGDNVGGCLVSFAIGFVILGLIGNIFC